MKERYALWGMVIATIGGIIVAIIQNSNIAAKQEVLISELNRRTIPQIEEALKLLNQEVHANAKAIAKLDVLISTCCKVTSSLVPAKPAQELLPESEGRLGSQDMVKSCSGETAMSNNVLLRTLCLDWEGGK